MAIRLRLSSESIILFSGEIQKKVDTMWYSANNIGERDGEYPHVRNSDVLAFCGVSALSGRIASLARARWNVVVPTTNSRKTKGLGNG